MQGLRKSKRVSWASDVNLCQMKLFLSEDSPAQVGMAAQDHLQEKASWTFHSGEIGSDGNLPPGFESTQPAGVLKNKLAQIPVIKWSCPPRIMLDPNWLIVAGEESQEVDIQKQREMRVLEAIYPRPSAIPANPLLAGVKESFHSDQHTLVIPVTPIEDEDASDPLSHALIKNDDAMNLPAVPLAPTTSSSQGTFTTVALAHQMAASGSAPGIEPHLVAAVAQSAIDAVMSSNDQGNLIDPELLMKILNNPQLVEQLVRLQGESSEMQNLPVASTVSPRVPSIPDALRTPGRNIEEQVPLQINKVEHAQGYGSRLEPSPTFVTSTSSSSLYPPNPSRIGDPISFRQPVLSISAQTSSVAPAPKDISYYKSLIQQHGGNRQEDNLPNFNSGNNKWRDSETKTTRACIFYNTPKGCRNGEKCSFDHGSTSQQRVNPIPDVQNNKRMKMDRGIYGT